MDHASPLHPRWCAPHHCCPTIHSSFHAITWRYRTSVITAALLYAVDSLQ